MDQMRCASAITICRLFMKMILSLPAKRMDLNLTQFPEDSCDQNSNVILSLGANNNDIDINETGVLQ